MRKAKKKFLLTIVSAVLCLLNVPGAAFVTYLAYLQSSVSHLAWLGVAAGTVCTYVFAVCAYASAEDLILSLRNRDYNSRDR